MKLDKLYARYASIIPDFDAFMKYIKRPLLRSFRINTLKAKRECVLSLLGDLKYVGLPFYEDGFSAKGNYSLGNHMTHGLGLIYVQEVASMIPVITLDPRPGEIVLDLCAAPGSKTTQIAQLMKNSGLLVANEINRKRMRGLIHNIKRCGLMNEVVITMNGQKIDRAFTDYFDRILIDAPCSAEGTVRKSKAVLYHWGTRNIQRMSRLQVGLLVSAFRALRPGGSMVYSTCTVAPEENEMVVSYLLERFTEAEILPIEIEGFKTRPGLSRWQGITFDPRTECCARVLPQDNDTAPFFIARLTKRGMIKPRIDYFGKVAFEQSLVNGMERKFGVPQKCFDGYAIFKEIDEAYISTKDVFSFRELKTRHRGLEFAKMYGHDIKPDNDMIQIFGSHATKNIIDLQLFQLKKFLRGEIIRIGSLPGIDNGFVMVRFKGLPVGTGKYNGTDLRSAVKRERRIP